MVNWNDAGNIAAWIALVVAIVSPPLTTIISSLLNHRFQIKMKTLELSETRTTKILDDYLESTAQFLRNSTIDNKMRYCSCFAKILSVLTDDEDQLKCLQIDQAIGEGNLDFAYELFSSFCFVDISKYYPTIEKKQAKKPQKNFPHIPKLFRRHFFKNNQTNNR